MKVDVSTFERGFERAVKLMEGISKQVKTSVPMSDWLNPKDIFGIHKKRKRKKK